MKRKIDVRRPNYALSELNAFLFSKRDLSEEEKSTIQLSLFFSIILDFPIFFLVIIINWPTRNKRKNNPFDNEEIIKEIEAKKAADARWSKKQEKPKRPKTTSSLSNKFNFKPSKITESPIKSKSQKKKQNKERLYIRNKKVPRWAENLK